MAHLIEHGPTLLSKETRWSTISGSRAQEWGRKVHSGDLSDPSVQMDLVGHLPIVFPRRFAWICHDRLDTDRGDLEVAFLDGEGLDVEVPTALQMDWATLMALGLELVTSCDARYIMERFFGISAYLWDPVLHQRGRAFQPNLILAALGDMVPGGMQPTAETQ